MKKTLLFVTLITFLLGSALAQQQVPNGDFEEWETHSTGYDFPSGWSSTNDILHLTLGMVNVTQSDNAVSGNYSAKLQTILAMGFVAPGVITLGELVLDIVNNTANFSGGIPFSDRPIALNGKFINLPAAGDLTMVGVVFTKYNPATGNSDTIGGGLGTFPETYTEWTDFTVPIQFGAELDPDTMNMYAVSSNIANLTDGGSIQLDNLSFEYEAGIEDINQIETSIFPNPASESITFSFGEQLKAELNIYGLDGQLIYKEKVNGIETTLELSDYASGTYFFALYENGKKMSSGQFLVNK